jgi:hypothetical protein
MSKPLFAFAALTGAAALAATAGSASAHHSYAMFDAQVTLTVPGTVVSWDWTNPHSFLQVISETGQHWSLEAASPSLLSRNGVTRNTFKPGDKVTVKLHPRRDKTEGGSLLSATLTDGRTVLFEAARPPRPAEAPAQ